MRHANAGAAMRLIADAVLEICKREELTTRKRYLSAWGTVEQSGRGWIYRWHADGLPALLGQGRECPIVCVSPDAAWSLFAVVLKGAQRAELRSFKREAREFAACIYGGLVTSACLLMLAMM